MNSKAPHYAEAEDSVIGSMLIDSECIPSTLEILDAEDFYSGANRIVYGAMQHLAKTNMAVDVVTVSDYLEKKGELEEIGGRACIAQYSSRTPTSANVESYARMVEEAAVSRRLISTAAKIAEIGYQGLPSDEALDKAESEIYRLSRARSNSSFDDLGELLGKSWKSMERAALGENVTIKSGIIPMDKVIGGWSNSDLIVVAARPSVGKTALAVNLATNAALRQGKAVAIFSLEMSGEQIATRILADAAHVDISKIRNGSGTPEEINKLAEAADRIKDARIYVDDASSLTPIEIRSRCRKLRQDKGLDMVVIDYIQLLSAVRQQKDANRVMETAEISRTLKQIARELNVPVIALSQLSRNSEYRDSGEPRLADLRDSGSIEQDADVVIMLWKPKEQTDEYYDTVSVKVAKNRNGPTGDLNLIFRKATTSFTTGEQ